MQGGGMTRGGPAGPSQPEEASLLALKEELLRKQAKLSQLLKNKNGAASSVRAVFFFVCHAQASSPKWGSRRRHRMLRSAGFHIQWFHLRVPRTIVGLLSRKDGRVAPLARFP